MSNRLPLKLPVRARVLSAAALGVACFLAALAAGAALVAPRKARHPVPGALTNVHLQLPACRLIDLERGELAADELRSGRVLMVYLRTDCTACLKEVEVISRLRRDTPPGLRIYGLAAESGSRLKDFAKEHKLTFPILSDEEGQLARSLDTRYFPSKYFVEDGVITKAWYGKTRDEAELRRQLDIR